MQLFDYSIFQLHASINRPMIDTRFIYNGIGWNEFQTLKSLKQKKYKRTVAIDTKTH